MQRCSAKSKRTGKRCKNYAIKAYGVCRMHGARGGPKTPLGLQKCKTSPTKHGFYSQEGLMERQLMQSQAKGKDFTDIGCTSNT